MNLKPLTYSLRTAYGCLLISDNPLSSVWYIGYNMLTNMKLFDWFLWNTYDPFIDGKMSTWLNIRKCTKITFSFRGVDLTRSNKCCMNIQALRHAFIDFRLETRVGNIQLYKLPYVRLQCLDKACDYRKTCVFSVVLITSCRKVL